MFATAHQRARNVAEMTAQALDGKALEAVIARMKELRDTKFAGNQKRLAGALGVTPTAVSDVLGGTKGPGLRMLIAVARELEISLDELIGLGPRTTSDTWGSLGGYVDVEKAARQAFPRVGDETWRALRMLRGVAPPALNPMALGMLAVAWDQHAPGASPAATPSPKRAAKRPAAPPSAAPKKPRAA